MAGIKTAVLIAGGQGTRIRSISGEKIPKALVPVAGKPIVFWQMEFLARYQIRRIAVMAGYLADQLRDRLLPEAKSLGMEITFFVEEKPLGTAGNLLSARDFLGNEPFFVVYADVVFDLDMERLGHFHLENHADATIVCHPNDHPHESDLLRTDRSGRVLEILPAKGRKEGWYRNLVPGAVYVVSNSVFEFLSGGSKLDFIKDVFPAMINAGKQVMAYNTPEYLRDMGTPERYLVAEEHIRSGRVAGMNYSKRRPAVFFDRDGVLNKELRGHGVLKAEDLELIPGAADAVRKVNDSGMLAVVVTNQPQVAKGFISFEDLEVIHAKLETLLGFEGAWIDRIYFCPHHPEKGFEGEVPWLKMECGCRKPKPGLLMNAARELPIDMRSSVMIGDSWRDAGAAKAAGVRFYGVRTGFGCERCVGDFLPDLIFDTVLDAVNFILSKDPVAGVIVSKIYDILQSKQGTVLVGVCGVARSGKSTLSHRIELMLEKKGVPVLRVHLDQWIIPKSERDPNSPPEEVNKVKCYRNIYSALKEGRAVVAPGYDPKTCERGEAVRFNPESKKVIILEGLFACHRFVREMLDFSIYVDSGYEVVEDRFMRFYQWKGLPLKERIQLFQRRVREEWPAIRTQRSYADMVVGVNEHVG